MVKQSTIRNQLISLYSLMDEAESKQAEAFKTVKKLGQKYPESNFRKSVPQDDVKLFNYLRTSPNSTKIMRQDDA